MAKERPDFNADSSVPMGAPSLLPEPTTPIHPYLPLLREMSPEEQMEWAAEFEKQHPEEAAEFIRQIKPWLDAARRGKETFRHKDN